MNSSPKVSIVLPTFNGSRYLRAAIDSCLAQTYTDWELIIVDDASSDATPDIIKQYLTMDSRIRSVRHDANRKLPAALNTGFSLSRGEFLTWTSDDNLYKPPAIDKMLEYLSNHPEVDIVYTDYDVIDEDDKLIKKVMVPPSENIVIENVVRASFMYRRSVQTSLGGYDENSFLAEDYEFWLRASATFKMEALHQVLYEYRVHRQSLSFKKAKEVKKKYRMTLKNNLDFIEWLSVREKAAIWMNIAAFAYEDKDYFDFKYFISKSFSTSPIVALLVATKILLVRRKTSLTRPVRLPKWLC